MRTSYRTVSQAASVEIEEKRSSFLGFCRPLANEEEANDFVNEIRSRYPDATHHVYAWLLGGPVKLQRFSDDGEPQGTAGLPVLDVLRKSDIEDAGIVVVRYFGGTLLGAGGLVRAYSKTAAAALAAAGQTRMSLCRIYRLTVSYKDYERLLTRLLAEGCVHTDSKFDIDVELIVGCSPQEEDGFFALCKDETAGAVLIEKIDERFLPLSYSERTDSTNGRSFKME